MKSVGLDVSLVASGVRLLPILTSSCPMEYALSADIPSVVSGSLKAFHSKVCSKKLPSLPHSD